MAKHPVGVYKFSAIEGTERGFYYALEAIGSMLFAWMLSIYLKTDMKAQEGTASLIFAVFGGATYIITWKSGQLMDKYGIKRIMRIACTIELIGAILTPINVPLGFVVVTLGAGAFKPVISTIIGRFYAPKDKRRDQGYGLFYVAINIGGIIGPLSVGVSSAAALALISSGADVAAIKSAWNVCLYTAIVFQLMCFVLMMLFVGRNVDDSDLQPEEQHEEVVVSEAEKAKRRWAMRLLCMVAFFFWAAFKQGPSTLTFWAQNHTNRVILGYDIPAVWFSNLNGIWVIFGTNILARLFLIHEPSTPRKMIYGMGLTSASFLIMAVAGYFNGTSPLWVSSCWTVLTFGELFMSPVGMSMISQLAPAGEEGRWMGNWFLSTAGGFIASGIVAKVRDVLSYGTIFSILSLVTGATAIFILAKEKELLEAFPTRIKPTAHDEMVNPNLKDAPIVTIT